MVSVGYLALTRPSEGHRGRSPEPEHFGDAGMNIFLGRTGAKVGPTYSIINYCRR